MASLGIIAAAGKASRFNGILKEMLPVEEGISLLERNINVLYGVADHIVIVTTPEKIAAHSIVTKRYNKVSLTLQKQPWDIMGAIWSGLWHPHTEVHFVMADTYVPMDAFMPEEKYDKVMCPFKMGMHWTNTPERFGCLYKGRIHNKMTLNEEYAPDPKWRAWGVLSWDSSITAEWREMGFTDYTEAINHAILNDPTYFYDLDYYYDIASWDDYWSLINETRFSTGRDRVAGEVYPKDWIDATRKRTGTRSRS